MKLWIATERDGRRRVCDERCHEAETAVCRCCCEGRFHGRGRDGSLAAAWEAFREEAEGGTVEAQLSFDFEGGGDA